MSEQTLNTSPVALVTGGASGIGLAIVSRLAAKGVTVYTTDINEQAWQQALADQPQLQRIHFHRLDMRDHVGLRGLVETLISAEDRLDILVNNAGIMPVGPTHEMSEDVVAAQLDILLHGPIVLTQAVVAAMLQLGTGGQIINISSTVAHMPSPLMSVYGAAKAGLLHFTRSIAAEYARAGIRANAICPGGVDTNLTSKALLAQIARNTPLGRLARPDEIAGLVLYLLGPEATYITGAAVTIDGGTSLGLPPADDAARSTGPAARTLSHTEAPAPATDRSVPAAPEPPSDLDRSLLPRVASIFEQVFGAAADEVELDTSPEDVAKWDSLGHMNLVSALEAAYAVRFEVDEVMEMTSVEQILQILTRRGAES